MLGLGLGLALANAAGCKKEAVEPPPLPGAVQKPELGFADDAQQVERAPIELTASDGSGLALVAISARAVVEDPLAFTELHLTFRNPEARRREGRFTMRLPEGAAISRFAMRVGDRFSEGEVVERRFAEQVYEDFLHRKQDPALLEHAAGNEFSARVFPIEPSADKEIIIAYSEELNTQREPYRIPLAGLSRLASLKVEVLLGNSSSSGLESSSAREKPEKLSLTRQEFSPSSDLLLRLPVRAPFALRSGGLAVMRVPVRLEVAPAPIESLTVLFDTSASRALGFAAQIERLSALLAELVAQQGKDFELRLVAFDQDTEEVFNGRAAALTLRDKGRLLTRDALGATNLQQALDKLAQAPLSSARLLIVSDGVITAGRPGDGVGASALQKLQKHGLKRVDVLAEGGVRDASTFARLTGDPALAPGLSLDAEESVAQSATRLLRAVAAPVAVEIPGATWVYPRALEGVQTGDERLVFAELPSGTTLKLGLGGAEARTLAALETPKPLLERAWARAKIEALTHTLHSPEALAGVSPAALTREILKLSTQHRVLSELTALLVLESDADYQRYMIDRNALANILSVGEEGLEVVDRGAPGAALAKDDLPLPTPQLSPHDLPPEAPVARDEEKREGEAPSSRRGAPEPMPAPAAQAPRAPSDERARSAPAAEAAPRKASAAPRSAPADDIGSLGSAAPPAPAKAAAPSPSAPARPEANQQVSAAAEKAAADLLEQASAAGRSGSGAANADVLSAAGGTRGGAGPGGYDPPSTTGSVLQPVQPVTLAVRAAVALHSVSGLDQAATAAALRAGLTTRARNCYQQGDPQGTEPERIYFDITVSERGTVSDAYVTSGGLRSAGIKSCLLAAVRGLQLPKPEGGSANLQAGVAFTSVLQTPSTTPTPPAVARPAAPRKVTVPVPAIEEAYSGVLAEVLAALRKGDVGAAHAAAKAAHEQDPADVMALVALGEALEAQHELPRAARVYGSLIDLFPSRADLRRMAGERLERLGDAGLALATDSYARAAEQRPDHPSSHRLWAFALLKQKQFAQAVEVLSAARLRGFRSDRFPGIERVLAEDLGIAAAAWIKHAPDAAAQARAALERLGLTPASKPSLRFVLNWETDANDVDFHIYDGRGGHASYLKPKLGSGGALVADVTTGYGPECFAIEGSSRAFPYVLQAHYFARGPMGYGMGKLEVLQHDGRGNLSFSEHPFVIMKDKAFVELARIDGKTLTKQAL